MKKTIGLGFTAEEITAFRNEKKKRDQEAMIEEQNDVALLSVSEKKALFAKKMVVDETATNEKRLKQDAALRSAKKKLQKDAPVALVAVGDESAAAENKPTEESSDAVEGESGSVAQKAAFFKSKIVELESAPKSAKKQKVTETAGTPMQCSTEEQVTDENTDNMMIVEGGSSNKRKLGGGAESKAQLRRFICM